MEPGSNAHTTRMDGLRTKLISTRKAISTLRQQAAHRRADADALRRQADQERHESVARRRTQLRRRITDAYDRAKAGRARKTAAHPKLAELRQTGTASLTSATGSPTGAMPRQTTATAQSCAVSTRGERPSVLVRRST
jgi:chromosome segregation ATPase